MILDTKRNASPRLARTRAGILAAAASMAALCAVAAGPRLVLAESSASASNSSSASSDGKVVTTEKSVVIANGIADEKSQNLGISAGPAKSRSMAVVETRNGNVVTRITASDDDDDSGPKVKSRAPSAGLEGDGPRAPRAPQGLPALPAKPGKPALAGSSRGDEDLEKRLDRLEKMVQSLVKEKAENRDFLFNRNFHYEMKEPMVMPHPKIDIDQWKQMGKLGEEADRMKKEFAKREADRRKDMDKAFAKMKEKGLEGEIALKAQRDALEATRSSLERELRNIERQMQQIERQQEKMERDRDEQERNREHSNRNEDSERSKKKEKAENRDSSKDSDDSGEKP